MKKIYNVKNNNNDYISCINIKFDQLEDLMSVEDNVNVYDKWINENGSIVNTALKPNHTIPHDNHNFGASGRVYYYDTELIVKPPSGYYIELVARSGTLLDALVKIDDNIPNYPSKEFK